MPIDNGNNKIVETNCRTLFEESSRTAEYLDKVSRCEIEMVDGELMTADGINVMDLGFV